MAKGARLRQVGFTLIEMVVVIGIIILATGFIVPSLSKFFTNRQLDNACTLITDTMTEVRQRAVTSKKPVRLVFLKRGIRVYDEGEKAWQGGIREYESGGKNLIRYSLEFAGQPYDEIAETVVDEPAGPISGQDVSLQYLPDGTVRYEPYQDVPTHRFQAKETADIVVSQRGGNRSFGLIDVRPTGRPYYQIVEAER